VNSKIKISMLGGLLTALPALALAASDVGFKTSVPTIDASAVSTSLTAQKLPVELAFPLTGGRAVQDLPGSALTQPLFLPEIQSAVEAKGVSPWLTTQVLDPSFEDYLSITIRYAAHAPADVLDGMYRTLHGVMQSDLPADKRAQISLLLSDRFAQILQEIRQTPDVSPDADAAMGRTLERFLADGNLISALARQRELQGILASIPAGKRRNNDKDNEWKISNRRMPPPSAGTRVYKTNFEQEERRIKDELWLRDQAKRRLELARSRGISQPIIDRLARELRRRSRDLRQTRDGLAANLDQSFNFRIRQHFALAPPDEPPQVSPWRVTPSSDLHVERDAQGYVLKVRLETKIQDQPVIDALRHAITSYWRGTIQEDGKVVPFRTEVTVDLLPVGSSFSSNGLQVIEGDATFVSNRTIYLARSNVLDNGIFAHEFGHLLGLPDEYRWRYDHRTRTEIETQDMSSLMASLQGRVQERHLKTVVGGLLTRLGN
jgi:hypothetical protein